MIRLLHFLLLPYHPGKGFIAGSEFGLRIRVASHPPPSSVSRGNRKPRRLLSEL
jgi:hypothetical protein